ncbi:hypothetical protein BH10ACI4_BH10ACI4_23130 [soil metagenome]
MRRNGFFSLLLAGAIALASQSASGQMVVHAVSGTVKAINPASKSLDVQIEDGATGHFKTSSKSSVALSLDNDLRGDAVDATDFHEPDSFVVVYYYGFGDNRTAVAIKDLGKGPFQKFEGTVLSFDKHQHVLSVKTKKSGIVKFRLSEKIVVDTGISLQSGQKYNPRKGYTVRVTATESNGEHVAVFVRSRQ